MAPRRVDILPAAHAGQQAGELGPRVALLELSERRRGHGRRGVAPQRRGTDGQGLQEARPEVLSEPRSSPFHSV